VHGETLASSGVTGSPSLTSSATAASAPGAYVLSAGPGSLAAANYAFRFVPGTLTVTPAAPSVVAVLVNNGGPRRGRVRSLTVVFSTVVQLDAGAFGLWRGRRPLRLRVRAQAADGRTVATLAVRGPGAVGGALPGGRYRLAIAADRVRAGGMALAGDAVFFFRRPGGGHGANQAGAAVFLGGFTPAPGRG
jgi:hypothetical protein